MTGGGRAKEGRGKGRKGGEGERKKSSEGGGGLVPTCLVGNFDKTGRTFSTSATSFWTNHSRI